MRHHYGRISAVVLLVALGACSSTSNDTSAEPSAAPAASVSPSAAEGFPIEAFAAISEDPVSEAKAEQLQAALDDVAGRTGISATVMTSGGTWSGATGKADGVRDVTIDDQFSIASTTKAIVAAQIMQMVETGEVGLDDPVADYLPPHLDFDTNGATIRQLVGMHSGIPEGGLDAGHRLETDEITPELLRLDQRHRWTPAEMLRELSPHRVPAGHRFEYSGTNYLLLGLAIEQVTGRPVADVLRDGVLSID